MSKTFENTYNTDLPNLVGILKTDFYSNFTETVSNIKYTDWIDDKREVKYTIKTSLKTSNVIETQTIKRMNVGFYHILCVQTYDNIPIKNTLKINLSKITNTKSKLNISYDIMSLKGPTIIWKKLINKNIDHLYKNFDDIIRLFIG